MSNLKKIIAWISAFAIIISVLCFPSFASSGSQYEQATVPFWDWFVRLGGNYNLIGTFLGYTSGTVCSKSDDGYHHANISQTEYGNGYYNCICSYCGQSFKAYESDLKQSYDKQVSDLPSSTYSSSGEYIFRLNFTSADKFTSGGVLDSFLGGSSFQVLFQSSSDNFQFQAHFDKFVAPVSGNYHLGYFISRPSTAESFRVVARNDQYPLFVYDRRFGQDRETSGRGRKGHGDGSPGGGPPGPHHVL